MTDLTERAREVFARLVDAYLQDGQPVGSRTLSRLLGGHLSPASIRNVMADLAELGLLSAPHVSAGRVPTDLGLRLFVDGLMEFGPLAETDRQRLEDECRLSGSNMQQVLDDASRTLAGLSACAGLVASQSAERPLRQVDFVALDPGRVLMVLVTSDGQVENRLLHLTERIAPGTLRAAANYLNQHLAGRTLAEAARAITADIAAHRTQLDALSARLVEAGLASQSAGTSGQLILRGQAKLLDDVAALADLERIRRLFDLLETQETIADLLSAAGGAPGVKIFIGAENPLFAEAGCSLILAPYHDSNAQLVGAVGVIGPTRLNYARIVPLVDYAARMVSHLLGAPPPPLALAPHHPQKSGA